MKHIVQFRPQKFYVPELPGSCVTEQRCVFCVGGIRCVCVHVRALLLKDTPVLGCVNVLELFFIH